MPTYEYHCSKCDETFSLTMTFADFDRRTRTPRCPKCKKSKSVENVIGGIQVKTSKKS